MNFQEFSIYLEKLEKTSSRLEITEILADLFKKADAKEIDKIVYLSLGNLAPRFESKVFNIAERMMIEAIAVAYGKDKKKVLELYKQKGDLGDVSSELSKDKSRGLTVKEVFKRLVKVADEEGEGSVERKIEGIAKLLNELDAKSAKYVTRIPLGKLRLGFSDKTILDAISWMERGDKTANKDLTRAYDVHPDAGSLAKEAKKHGIKNAAKTLGPKVGVPILPMLAQRLKSPKDMIDKMGELAVEPKLDGLRLQLHFNRSGFKDGNKVKAFTRNLNETSWMFPELGLLIEATDAKEIIVDAEAVGVDSEAKKLANFQTTMTRRRKHDVEETANKIPIRFYLFDVMYKDGKDLTTHEYLDRRKILDNLLNESDTFQIVDYEVTDDPKQITNMHHEHVAEGLEGIIVKKLDGKYVSGRTGWRWVKMKEEEGKDAKLSDTVDCVVMGYTAGRGKRAVFGIGQFLAGIVDGEEIKSVTKVGTGMTDEQFKELNKRLKKLQVKNKPKEYRVDKNLEPDFWVKPELVVELAADEVTKSPIHKAGYALRFPRLINFRDDKNVESATTLKELKEISSL